MSETTETSELQAVINETVAGALDAVAARRYAEALAGLALSNRPLEFADDLKPAGASDADLSAAMATVAAELAETPDDTSAAETVLRAGESERKKVRAAERARVKKVRDAMATLGLTLGDLRAALSVADDR